MQQRSRDVASSIAGRNVGRVITEGGQFVSRILSKVERMVETRKAGLEITENGVDPLEIQFHAPVS